MNLNRVLGERDVQEAAAKRKAATQFKPTVGLHAAPPSNDRDKLTDAGSEYRLKRPGTTISCGGIHARRVRSSVARRFFVGREERRKMRAGRRVRSTNPTIFRH